ncbi:N-acetylmuramidase family protein [Lunatibacter salilacus]|uniref:N-acetylmuramidase family protein n=1 Tax=Lunatibacter salilacus TaxID=2483804 RepID=UPI00131B9A3F|nr:N-acetylmuramidase domain-containing protein [Lunatibacter salilacus]
MTTSNKPNTETTQVAANYATLEPEKKTPLFQNKRYLFLQLGAVILITLVVLIGIKNGIEATNTSFEIAIILLTSIAFLYGITARQMNPKAKNENKYNNPYHTFFFRGTVILTSLLTLFGIFGSFFVYVEHGNLFQAVGLATAIIWISVFLVYFMWSVYFYNINYGLTDEDWNRIYEAKDRQIEGLSTQEGELDVPKHNPFRSQTFGLPPGTVRGMIAFTLLMGGMSLLITSYGSGYSGVDIALLRQQFEFFETAFLMMIAFYFGDRSLKYLSKRWTDPNAQQATASGRPATTTSGEVTSSPQIVGDSIDEDDREFMEEDRDFLTENKSITATPLITNVRQTLSTSLEKPIIESPGEEFVQLKDNTFQKVLSDMDIRIALEELKDRDNIDLSLPVVKAIVTVESAGKGHLPDGRAKILFEGHKLWQWLEKEKMDPKLSVKGNEDILYQKWTKAHYKGGAREYERLEKARKLNPKAAVYSASWGLFQILGENLTGFIKGRNYKDHEEFEAKQHESEYFHFLDFLEFIKTKKIRGKALIDFVSEQNNGNYDWESFAYGYNGSGYKQNKYDTKMKAAYEKFKADGL